MPPESRRADRVRHTSSTRLWFTTDPAAFLTVAASYLKADPVLCTVVASMAHREAVTGRESPAGSPYWYLVVHDDDSSAVVGVAMRTAPNPPHALFVLPMPDQAALDLARALHQRGEPVGAVNGALPSSHLVAAETGRLTGAAVDVSVPTRLYELHRVDAPTPVPGGLETATRSDLDLVLSWLGRFQHDAELQAGRTPTSHPGPDRQHTASRIEAGYYLLWWVDGQPVALCALSPASFGAQRISLVYTPAEHRGHGWAGAAVAELGRRILAAGARPCLYTDQDNPVSNHLYTSLGFEPVVDMVNLTLSRSAP